MKLTDKPAQLGVPFASAGDKDTIPVNATQGTKEKGRAAWDSGFPPLTMTAIAAGGIPPSGKDFNGVLNAISAGLRFAMAGGLYPYDADFSAVIGGYPLGAILISADGSKVWWNVSDANTTDPDSDKAAGWKNLLQDPEGLFLKKAQNLADLQNKGTARTNLELDKVGNWMAVQANGGLHSSGNHHIYIDWGGDSKFHGTVDSTDVGEFFTTQNPPTPAQSNSYPMWGGDLNEEASVSVISNVKSGTTGDTLYSPMFRCVLKGRGGDQDFKDGASGFMRIVENVGTNAYLQLQWDGFGSVHEFRFDQQGNSQVYGKVYTGSGASFLAEDGNVYGSVWGGYLSNWVAGQIGAQINNNNVWVSNTFQPRNTGSPGAGWWRDSVTGLIIQAGTIAIQPSGSSSTASFSFPLTFPNGVVAITGNTAGPASSAGYVACAAFTNLSSSGGSVFIDTNASRNMDQTQYVRYIAYGV